MLLCLLRGSNSRDPIFALSAPGASQVFLETSFGLVLFLATDRFSVLMICLDSVVSGLLCIDNFFYLSLHFFLLTVTGLRICASSEL